MGPEILIVGDRTQRGSLLPRVQDLGYLVTPVRERELTARVEANPAPVAVLICLGGEDPAALIDAVRNGRDDVPVILYGSLGGAVHDLADVLELGADHFLAEPVGDEELAQVLAEMAGPGEDPTADAGPRESVLPVTQQPEPGEGEEGDPVLGQLHRTLEIVAARLHTEAPAEAETERDGLDLEALGLDAVPDVDGASNEELDPDRGRREASDPATPRRPDSTLRLSEPPRRGAPSRISAGRSRETDASAATVRLGVGQGAVQRAAGESGREERAVGPGSTQRLNVQREEFGREERAAGPGSNVQRSSVQREEFGLEERAAGPGSMQRSSVQREELGRAVVSGSTQRSSAGREEFGRAVVSGSSQRSSAGREAGPREEFGREERGGAGPRPSTSSASRAEPGREEFVREAAVQRSGPVRESVPRAGGVREEFGREDGPGSMSRSSGSAVSMSRGAGWPERSEPVREDRSWPGRSEPVREDRSWPGRSEPVREDRSWPGRSEPVREDRSLPGRSEPVREDRSAGEVTARVVVRRDVAARDGGERLAGVEVVTRLARLHRQRGSGRVVVGFAGGAVKEVWWRAGEPVFAASTAATDGLLPRLQARGLVSRAEAAQAGSRVDGDLVASARRLAQAGLLKPREQAEAVRDVVESISLSLCRDDATRWSLDQTPAPATVTLGVPVAALLVRGVRLGMSERRLRDELSGETCLKVQEAELAGLAARLGDPEAAAWLELLDGTRSLDALVEEDGLEARGLWATAVVLVALGLAEEVDESASLVAIDQRRVSERLALAHASDYFSLLGVGRTAGRAEVVRAHADLRATFAPEQLEPASRTALAAPLRELQAALDEARDVLLDEALRTAYLARLTEAGA